MAQSAVRVRADAAGVIFGALSDPVRRTIVRTLGDGERCVSELMAVTQRRQQAVSHHLTILKLNGLVAPDRRGKRNVYALCERGRDAAALLELVLGE